MYTYMPIIIFETNSNKHFQCTFSPTLIMNLIYICKQCSNEVLFKGSSEGPSGYETDVCEPQSPLL
jgi:hypothetical protein